MSRLINRLRGRVYGWFESKDAQPAASRVPAKFDSRARLLLQNLEDRVVPAYYMVTGDGDAGGLPLGTGTGTQADPFLIGSFRSAIQQATATPDDDEITFDTAFFNTAKTITLTSALPALGSATAGALTISGPGQNLLTITGASLYRHFDISGGNAGQAFIIKDLTLANGSAATASSINVGDEALTLQNVTIRNSTASGNGTILVASAAGSVTATGSSFLNNKAARGAGICLSAASQVTLTNSFMSGNTTTNNGGAIYFFSGGGITSNNNTFNNNTSGAQGGAVYLYGAMSPAIFSNNTFVGNSSTGGPGGAIVILSFSGTVSVQNSTLTGNSASATGGGIHSGTAGVLTVNSSVVSGNSAAGAANDINATNATVNFSALGTLAGLTTPTTSNNLVGQNLKLIGLTNAGGPVLTVLPASDSPLVDAGDPAASLTVDARGQARPYNTTVDIGAVERQLAEPPVYVPTTFPNITVGGGATANITVNYYDGVGLDLSTLNQGDEVRVTYPNGTSVLASWVSTAGTATNAIVTYSFAVPGGTLGTEDNGLYTVSLEPNQVKNTGGLAAGAGTFGTVRVAIPSTFTVLNTNDTGAGSLRQAILDANASANTADTIIFNADNDPGETNFTLPQTINLTTSLPTLTDALTVTGPGSQLLTIQRGAAVTTAVTYFVMGAAGQQAFAFSGMTLNRGGTATSGNGNYFTTSDETVTLADMVLTGASGGNSAIFGGASNLGNVTLNNSLIYNNTASSTNLINFVGANLTINNTSIISNSSSGGSPVLLNNTAIPVNFTLSNSTIAGNVGVSTGAITLNMTGTANIVNSTIAGNSATDGAAGLGFGAGGIGRTVNTNGVIPSTLNIVSSIVAGNRSGTNRGLDQRPDISIGQGMTVTVNSSLIGAADTFTYSTSNAALNKIGTRVSPLDPELSLLTSYGFGGNGKALVPSATSLALNAGTNPNGLSTDVRGLTRVVGTIDMGAVERQASGEAALGYLPNNYADQFTADATRDIYVNFFGIDTSSLATGNITVTSPVGTFLGTPVYDSATTTNGVTKAKYVLTAPVNTVAGWDANDTGLYTVNLLANQVKDSGAVPIAAGTIGVFSSRVGRTLTVTTGTDNLSTPTAGAGTGTLRQAIIDANFFFGNQDTIVFDPGVTLNKVTLAALPTISDSVTITGNGSANTTIQRVGSVTAMNMLTVSALGIATVNISGLNILGNASSALSLGDENVTLTDVKVSGVSTTSSGGGITWSPVNASRLSISGSDISGNSAASGGGINVASGFGTVSIDKSTIANNSASASGGGINFATTAAPQSFFLTNSTLSGNTASTTTTNYGGGGVSFAGAVSAGNFLIRNSTLSGNKALNGGGLLIRSGVTQLGSFNIQNSTFTANQSTNVNPNTGTAAFGGGGIAVTTVATAPVTVNIVSTILSGNTAAPANGADDLSVNPVGVTVNSSFNAIGTTTGYTLASTNNDLPTASAAIAELKLSTLGITAPSTTKTHALGTGSTAISAGFNPSNITPALTKDQNGNNRVIGSIDIGAVERLPIPGAFLGDPLLPVTDNTNNPYYFYITYADDAGISRATIGDGATDVTVTRLDGGFSVNATFDSADSAIDAPVIKAKYFFVPPSGTWDGSVNAGQYSFTTILNGIKSISLVSVPVTTVATLTTQLPNSVFRVTNTNDSGTGSLRQAILTANASTGTSDTIVFDTTAFAAPQTINLASSLPTVSDKLTITGPNPTTAKLTVAGNSSFRLLEIDDADVGNVMEIFLSNFTLTGGSASSLQGGGIRVSAGDQLTLTDFAITNSKITGNGGAIGFVANGGNKLTLTRTTLSGNSSSGAGGALDGGGSGLNLTVTDSTVSNNTATTGGAFGLAGGTALVVSITGSTLSGNVATSGSGGALRFYGGDISISNSTLSGNTASATGGALNFFQVYADTALRIRNSTITANKASTNGGGIGRTSTTSFSDGFITIDSTIIAGNTNASTPDLFFALGTPQNIGGDYNLIGAADVGNFSFASALNNIVGTKATPQPAGLGGLANNGGPTLTHALLLGSAAIDKGSNIAPALTNDQRGTGFNRVDAGGLAVADIGAYERKQGVPLAAAASPFTNIDFANYTTSNPYFFTVVYSNETDIDFSSIGGNDVLVTGPNLYSKFGTVVSVTPSGPSNSPTFTVKYSIPSPSNPSGWAIADNGNYTVTAQGGNVTSGASSIVTTVLGTFNVNVPQTFTVTNNADTGPGSLREAINSANNNPGLDNIIFDPTYFTTAKTVAERTIVNATLLPDFTLAGGGVNMVGPTGAGTAMAFVDANKLGRHFNLSANAAGTVFVISNLTLRNASGTGAGGSILLGDESLTLNNVTLTGNTGGTGGSIYLTGGGSLTMNNSTISGSSSTGAGGAIRTTGAVTVNINNSTITGSTSTGVGGAFFNNGVGAVITVESSTISNNRANSTSFGGGAMYLTAAQVNINNSTISGNSSAGTAGGGALYTWSTPGSLTIVNSTISSNTGTNGGAIRMQNSAWPLAIYNSTIVDNSATASTTAGGGISTVSGVTVTLDSTVVARNSASAGTANDFNNAGTINANYSIYSTTPNGTLNETSSFTYTLAEIGLAGSLANNGGSTLTYTYSSDSKLIDAGQNTKALATDQRGGSFARTINGLTDIGAIERVPGQPIATASGLVNVAADLPGVNNPYTFTVTYSVETGTNMLASSINNNNNAVRVTGPGGFNKLATWVSSTPNTNANSIAAVYKFNPGTNPGDPWTTSLNGTYTVSMEPNQVTTAVTNQFVIGGTLGTFLVGLPLVVVVNTDADTVDADPTITSLREAIIATNNGNGTDVINFNTVDDPFNPNDVVFTTAKTITLASALPVISDAVTINGPGTSKLTVSGANSFRVFETTGAPAKALININNLTVSGGNVVGNGGGILIGDEDVTLTNVEVSNNTASTNGGGISVSSLGGQLTMNGGAIRNNTSTTSFGGGLATSVSSGNNNITVMNGVTVSGNSSAGVGGGISLFWPGTLTLTNSTINNNSSNSFGGGIYLYNTGTTATISSSTIVNNSSASTGGGIGMVLGNGILNLRNSTLTGNTAVTGGGLGTTSTWTLNIESSIISGNTGTNPDISNTGTTNIDYSAYGDAAGFTPTGANNLVGASLNLQPLADNGGPTQTVALGAGSLAINAGSNPNSLAFDQRGTGFPRVVGSAADIGAFEVQGAAAPVVTGIVVNDGNAQRSRLTKVVVNFASPIDLAQFSAPGAVFFTRIGVANNNVEPLGTVVDSTNGLIIAPATGTGSSITLTFQNINNAGLDFGSLSDGRWSLSVVPASYVANAGNTGNNLRRLFGDSDNNGTVDTSDFGFFPPFGAPVATPPANPFPEIFDFNSNNDIDSGTDFAEFGNRFGVSLS